MGCFSNSRIIGIGEHWKQLVTCIAQIIDDLVLRQFCLFPSLHWEHGILFSYPGWKIASSTDIANCCMIHSFSMSPYRLDYDYLLFRRMVKLEEIELGQSDYINSSIFHYHKYSNRFYCVVVSIKNLNFQSTVNLCHSSTLSLFLSHLLISLEWWYFSIRWIFNSKL